MPEYNLQGYVISETEEDLKWFRFEEDELEDDYFLEEISGKCFLDENNDLLVLLPSKNNVPARFKSEEELNNYFASLPKLGKTKGGLR